MNTTTMTARDAFAALAAAQGSDPRTVRWDLAATLVLRSEAHFGGRDELLDVDGPVDLPLRRDDAGRACTAFSSVTGALSHHWQDRHHGYRVPGPTAELFGSTLGKGRLEGPALVWRAPAGMPESLVRSHNHLDPHTGTSPDGALWSTEVLPVGSSTVLVITLLVTPEEETDRLAELELACSGLHAGPDGIRWGTRKRAGGGAADATGWVAARHDLAGTAGFLDAHRHTHAELSRRLGDALAGDGAHASLREALTAAGAQPAWSRADTRRWAEIRMTVAVGVPAGDGTVLPGLLLVADTPPPGLEDVDTVQRHIPYPDPDRPGTRWRLAIGGEPVHSWLKRGAYLAAAGVAGTDPDRAARAEQLVQDWFGALDPGGQPGPAGRIVIGHDTSLHAASLLRRGRVPLDPVFGGAIDGLLHDEAVAAGGHASITVQVRSADPAVLGLLTRTAWDAAKLGLVTIGGHGHGLVTVTAATCVRHEPDGDSAPIDLLADEPDPTVTRWVAALHDLLGPAGPATGKEPGP